MERYRIIDEPKSKPWGEKLIVDPIFILLAAILIPLVWNPPYLGRFWMPSVWLFVNGLALGSSTLGKEIRALLAGGLLCLAVFYLSMLIPRWSNGLVTLQDILPYARIILFGVFFMTIYLVVFQQGRSYQLFQYVRGGE